MQRATPSSHGRLKRRCTNCTPCLHVKVEQDFAACISFPHGRLKRKFAACKEARTDTPSSKRVKRKPESSPEMKQETDIKLEPGIKQEPEPFTIRGYFGIGE